MKKLITTLVISAFASAGFCQKIAQGNWNGKLNAGAELRIAIHIKKDDSGPYSATMDSPDQGAKGIPFSSATVDGDSLHLKMDMIKGGYDGRFVNDTTIKGIWRQGPSKFPLNIRKGDIPELKRPQTPKPPFGYKADDVEYDNSDKTVHFGATLTYPSNGVRFPAAILISGSGQQDRDETLFEHKPFAVIADYLTKQGFAILRVDDRGKGKTKGELKTATSADFAKDVEESLAFLKQQPQIDTTRLGLIGHSEGGLIAAIVSSRNKGIAFMVLLASPGENGTVLLGEQNEALVRSQGADSASAVAYKDLYLRQMKTIVEASDTATAFVNSLKAFNDWKAGTSSAILAALGMSGNEGLNEDIRAKIKAVNNPWLQYFLKSDAGKLFEKTTAKVLALNGEKDVQVLAASNIAGIKKALKKSKSKVYETKILPGLNHLFQHCTACTVKEYGELEETFSLEALTIMGDWLKKEVR